MASRVTRIQDFARGAVTLSESAVSKTLLRRPGAALTAASSPLVHGEEYPGQKILTPEAIRVRQEGWQRKILEYAQQVPEVAGAASLVRNSASRVKFVVVPGPNSDPGLVADCQARVDALDKGRIARLIFLAGETYIVWPDDDEAPFSLSIAELRTTVEPYQFRGATTWKDLPAQWNFLRTWIPSDTNRYQASSPNQAAIDLIDAMYLHQLADTSVAMSRLAGAGVLVWPSSRQREGIGPDGAPKPGSQEELVANFSKAAMKSIKDRSAVEATVPYVVFVDPNQQNYKPEMLRIEREDYAEQYRERFETYRLRYATAIDLPIESTTGMGETNHWSAWAIREDKWREYLAPIMEIPRQAIEWNILRKKDPTLRLEIDGSELIAKPDQSANMLRLLQLGVIEEKYAFDQMNLDPSKARMAPERAYATQQMEGIPSDMSLGGERGGGQYRD